jgi:hypothetical protein
LDLAGLAGGGILAPETRWPDLGRSLAERFCNDFSGQTVLFGDLPGGIIDDVNFIVAHPLWDERAPGQRLAEARAEAGPGSRIVNYFDLSRRPAWVFQSLMQRP